jgi:hypothetical protein
LDPLRLVGEPRKDRAVEPVSDQFLERVLAALSRAQQVFGGQSPPADPPNFMADRGLEDHLGLGYFGSSSARGERR